MRYLAPLFAVIIAFCATADAAQKSKKGVCRLDHKYSAMRCGGSDKKLAHCLSGGNVMSGFYIKLGKCYQDNGGGEEAPTRVARIEARPHCP
jgi:hypothetical protein